MNIRKNIALSFAVLGLLGAGAMAGSELGSTAQVASNDLGATGGSIYHYDEVQPFTTDVYNIWFDGERLTEIMVSGDGSTDLDLFVYDENGNLIAYDNDLTDDCYVSFTPMWTGQFRVEIRNLGSRWNGYLLMTN